MNPYIMTPTTVSVFVSGKPYSIDNTHPNFQRVRDSIRDKRFDEIPELCNPVIRIKKFFNDRVTIDETGKIEIDGFPLHGVLAARVDDMIATGHDAFPLINFLANLRQNPANHAVEELYLFLEAGQLPITEDGHFLAYKSVRSDYGSIYDNGQTMNKPGMVVEMQRNAVDDARQRTCSHGLHFCSRAYLPHYGYGDNGKVVIVKINPRDVVSIPSDYNNTKGRTCRYEVVGELNETFTHDRMEAPVTGGRVRKLVIAHLRALTNDGKVVEGILLIDTGYLDEDGELNLFDFAERNAADVEEWHTQDGMFVNSFDVDLDSAKCYDVEEE